MTANNQRESEVYDEGYRDGVNNVKDKFTRHENNTKRLYAVLVAICIITITVVTTVMLDASQKRDVVLKTQCTQEGGIWTTSGCAWSAK